mgnify:CR=1 FL=1
MRRPDIRFIWSRTAGHRSAHHEPSLRSRIQLPKGLIYELQKMYYDTAQAYNPYTLPSFKKLVPATHILFGTDFPFAAGSAAVGKGLKDNGDFTAAELRMIDRENALGLFRG